MREDQWQVGSIYVTVDGHDTICECRESCRHAGFAAAAFSADNGYFESSGQSCWILKCWYFKVLDSKVLDGKVLDSKVLDGKVLDGKVLDDKVLDGEVLDSKVLRERVKSCQS